jgi:hypothetical protein
MRDRSMRKHPRARSHHLAPGFRLEQTPKEQFLDPTQGLRAPYCTRGLFSFSFSFPVSFILLLSSCSTYHTTDSSALIYCTRALLSLSRDASYNSKRDSY